MLSAGIPVDQALKIIEETDDQIGELSESLLNKVLSGHMLSHAMSQHQDQFSGIEIGLVRAGEETGDLGGVIGKLAELTERGERLRRMLVAALTYPAVQAVTLVLIALLFVAALPPDEIFGSFGALPKPTRILVAMSTVLRNPLFWVFILVWEFVWSITLKRAWRSRAFRHYVHARALEWPVVSALVRKADASRLVFSMTVLLDVGLSLTAALKLAEGTLSNLELQKRLQAARTQIVQGSSLASAFRGTHFLPPLVVSMTEVGEESGQLVKVLRPLIDTLEEEVESQLTALVRLLEPLMMAIAGGVTCFVAVAALMPIINMISEL